MKISLFKLFILMSFLSSTPNSFAAPATPEAQFKENFVSLQEVDSSILIEMRYFGTHNFVGRPITGYHAPKCFLTRNAASALKKVQEELKKYSMTLKVYDCYRPQKAVDDFVVWAKNPSDLKMQKEFYPTVDKKNLFKDGYIAEKSGHSRGSTVDLTIVPIPIPQQPEWTPTQGPLKLVECTASALNRFQDNSLDMGTGYDCFDPASHTAHPHIGFEQKKNRLFLKSILEKYGFTNLAEEWWHFTLKNEPFPNTFFDIDVK